MRKLLLFDALGFIGAAAHTQPTAAPALNLLTALQTEQWLASQMNMTLKTQEAPQALTQIPEL